MYLDSQNIFPKLHDFLCSVTRMHVFIVENNPILGEMKIYILFRLF
jgi:hypothetical protein